MYGPDPFTTMAYARMLRIQAAERERVQRRRSQRPRYDEAAEMTTTQPRAELNGRLGALRALFSRPAVAFRWHGRPRQAS